MKELAATVGVLAALVLVFVVAPLVLFLLGFGGVWLLIALGFCALFALAWFEEYHPCR